MIVIILVVLILMCGGIGVQAPTGPYRYGYSGLSFILFILLILYLMHVVPATL